MNNDKEILKGHVRWSREGYTPGKAADCVYYRVFVIRKRGMASVKDDG